MKEINIGARISCFDMYALSQSGGFMLLDLKVQHDTAVILEGCKDMVRIIVSNRAVWREVKQSRFSLCFHVR